MTRKLFYAILILIASSCDKISDIIKPKDSRFVSSFSDIITKYNDIYLEIDGRVAGFRPPISARTLAYYNITRYEAISSQFVDSKPILWPDVKIPKPSPDSVYHWGLVLNTASDIALKVYFATSKEIDFLKIDSLSKRFEAEFKKDVPPDVLRRSKTLGIEVFQEIYNYSITDGQSNIAFNNKPRDYFPPKGDDKWVSTPPDNLNALTPRWGQVRTFALQPIDRAIEPPHAFSIDEKSNFYVEANEVYKESTNISADKLWAAEFWSDDASTFTIDAAARQFCILNEILKTEKPSVEECLKLCTQLGVALHDGAVACWDNKYKYSLLRPVTYINKYIDKDWRPLLRDPTKPAGQQIGVTPQHPSYPSGHAVFAGIGEAIFTAKWGTKYKWTDTNPFGRSNYYNTKKRTFNSFKEMAEENAYSRIALGVHYRQDCSAGLVLGRKVGLRVLSIPWDI